MNDPNKPSAEHLNENILSTDNALQSTENNPQLHDKKEKDCDCHGEHACDCDEEKDCGCHSEHACDCNEEKDKDCNCGDSCDCDEENNCGCIDKHACDCNEEKDKDCSCGDSCDCNEENNCGCVGEHACDCNEEKDKDCSCGDSCDCDEENNCGCIGESSKKKGPCAFLTFLLAFLALAAAGYHEYQWQQMRANQQTFQSDSEKNIDALKNTVAQFDQGLDKAQVSHLIAEAIKALPLPPSEQEIGVFVEQKMKEQAEHTIKQAHSVAQESVAEFARTHDLNDIRATQASTEAKVQEAVDAFQHTATTAKESFTALADQATKQFTNLTQQAHPQPLIDALALADAAYQHNDYFAAAQFLNQALYRFEALNLMQTPFAAFKEPITAAQTQLASLIKADQERAQQLIALTESVDSWSFKSFEPVQVTMEDEASDETNLMSQAEQWGKQLLSKAVVIHKNDLSAAERVPANKAQRAIIRETIRLDVAYLRNAAMLHDRVGAKMAADDLTALITRYFAANDEAVQSALSVLSQFGADEPQPLEITTIIKAVKEAAGE
ncbi:VESA1 domain-containing protein [Dichelobacter nodosus]|uniref:hypothetical protein n=1 Tax=Dichelobacter nodosus TaxID=870 RepID=UPI00107EB830|nr:hypothetical protein [Dichelobacter nodosus]TGA64404.1 hypothetical protein E5E99_04545 [Dichelobacter nodosus]